MANIPDLVTLLNLDPRSSVSSSGEFHRTILISKQFDNTSDFAFNNLLHHFSRKDPTTPVLVVTLSHDWKHYSSSAAKCGSNLRRIQNQGNMDTLNVMQAYLDSIDHGDDNFDCCSFILDKVKQFVEESSCGEAKEPVAVMIDDLSIMNSIGVPVSEIYKLVCDIYYIVLKRTKTSPYRETKLSHLIVQTMQPQENGVDDDLNFLIANLANISDIWISLKPLQTGYSSHVDGTIKILDNRQQAPHAPTSQCQPPAFPLIQPASGSYGEIGTKRALYYKLGDRRAKLSSSALALS